MANPYTVLNARFEDDDEVIRGHYLEAIRQHPPERDPDTFRRVREAYERIKDESSRLAFLLFEPAQGESIEELIEEEKCHTLTKRIGLSTLVRLLDENT